MRKRLSLLVLMFTILILAAGCRSQCNHPPSQSLENIIAVELIYIPPASSFSYEIIRNAQVLNTIDSEHWKMVLNEVKAVPCVRAFFDPGIGFHRNVVRIQYKDGTIDLISDSGVGVWDGYDWSFESHVIDKEEYDVFCDQIIGE